MKNKLTVFLIIGTIMTLIGCGPDQTEEDKFNSVSQSSVSTTTCKNVNPINGKCED